MTVQMEAAAPTANSFDAHRVMASLMVRVMQTFRDAMDVDDLEVGDLALLNFVSTVPNWRDELVEFLLNVTGDDPQRVLQRALEAGRLRADDEGHLFATEKVGQLMQLLLPAAQKFNQAWRQKLAGDFSPQALDTFLGMLQHASGPAPATKRSASANSIT